MTARILGTELWNTESGLASPPAIRRLVRFGVGRLLWATRHPNIAQASTPRPIASRPWAMTQCCSPYVLRKTGDRAAPAPFRAYRQGAALRGSTAHSGSTGNGQAERALEVSRSIQPDSRVVEAAPRLRGIVFPILLKE